MNLQLLLALVIGIALIVFLILKTRLDAFAALLIGAIVVGTIAGSPVSETLASIIKGFGKTLGSIGIVIGLGVAVGKMLEVSGGADALAKAFLKAFGKGREPWAMTTTGALVSIPVFCDSGFVIMNPLAKSIARAKWIASKSTSYVTLALALGCGMTLTHHLVPPTPGPLAVAGILGADLGGLIIAGLIFAVILVPVVVFYAKWMGPQLESQLTEKVKEEVYAGVAAGSADAAAPVETSSSGTGDAVAQPERKPVSAWLASLPLLIPLVLIVANTAATAVDKANQGVLSPSDEYNPSAYAQTLGFIGHPVVALLIGLILAVYVLLPSLTPRKKVHAWLAESAAAAGLILLITGAGGALGQVLRDSGVGDELATGVSRLALPAVLIPFLIASLVRVAQGSGTVAMITAASVSAPIVATLDLAPLAAALACCAGSIVFSYFNDSYFWVVTRFTGLEGVAALKGWSGITTVVWLVSLPLVLIAGAVL